MFFFGLALMLMLVLSLLGRRLGGFRMGFYLIGSLLGFGVAWLLPGLGGPVAGLISDHPMIRHFLSPVIVFFFPLGITIAISEPIYFKSIYLHYKYTYAEEDFFVWEDFNMALGTTVGLLLGVVLTLMLALGVHVIGYATIQMQTSGEAPQPSAADSAKTTAPENTDTSEADPFLLRTINQFYNDLHTIGLSTVVGWLDPTSKKHRQLADLFGIIYHNPSPAFYTRLSAYPDLIAIYYHEEFTKLRENAEFRRMLEEKAGILKITHHDSLAKVWRDDRLRSLAERIKLDDLLDYLQTGQSKKFAAPELRKKKLPEVFGRWRMDADQTFGVFRTQNRNISPADLRRLYAILKSLEQDLHVAFASDADAKNPAFSFYLEGNGFPAQAMFRARRAGAGAGTLIMQAPALPPPGKRELLATGKCSQVGSRFSTKVKIKGQNNEVEFIFQMYNQTLVAYIPQFNNDPYCFMRVKP
ncbi:MAG: hypothetical protein VX705_10010 [Verrucomicrobiota bacterium]|nr:hypothetical protein [Verrucomicrobiota bacterium]